MKQVLKLVIKRWMSSLVLVTGFLVVSGCVLWVFGRFNISHSFDSEEGLKHSLKQTNLIVANVSVFATLITAVKLVRYNELRSMLLLGISPRILMTVFVGIVFAFGLFTRPMISLTETLIGVFSATSDGDSPFNIGLILRMTLLEPLLPCATLAPGLPILFSLRQNSLILAMLKAIVISSILLAFFNGDTLNLGINQVLPDWWNSWAKYVAALVILVASFVITGWGRKKPLNVTMNSEIDGHYKREDIRLTDVDIQSANSESAPESVPLTNGELALNNQLVDAIGLTRVSGNETSSPIANLVFVHGLGGGSQTTWASDGDVEKFFPDWISREFPMLKVWVLGYGTNISAWKERSMPLADLGNQILEELHVEEIADQPIIFITHSMGGLVVKQILSHARSQGVDRWEVIAKQTRGIAFLATPHSGSNLANFAEFASIVLRTNEQTSELKQHSSRLRELHGSFLKFVSDFGPVCRTYAERREVKPGIKVFSFNVKIPKGILVVDETSAEPNIPGERAIPLDEDHISICKPVDRKSQIYKYIKSFLNETLETIANS